MTTASIQFSAVTKLFPGMDRPAVDSLDMSIAPGEVVVLIGPSGCGKTTTLKMINRLIEPTSGDILVNGRRILDTPVLELRRSLGYVIQHIGLFPHMTIAQNVAVVPELLGWPRPRIEARIDELLNLVGLPPDTFRGRRPRQLSGGQQQRVGVARALAADPPILLMDEPFGALDPITRGNLQREVVDIQRKLRKTVVMVTHDMDEAVKLGDRIVIMDAGRIAQSGAPNELLARPANKFVADLLGQDRLIKLLQTIKVGRAMRAGAPTETDAPRISVDANMQDALLTFLSSTRETASVVDDSGAIIGRLDRASCFTCAHAA